jgi:hypothetical protein
MPLVSPIPGRSLGEADQWAFFTEPNHDRGVVDVEACVFIGGAGRSATPSGSVAPYADMHREAATGDSYSTGCRYVAGRLFSLK